VEVATKAATLLNSVQKCTFLVAALVMQHTSWYNPACLKTAAKERIGYISSD